MVQFCSVTWCRLALLISGLLFSLPPARAAAVVIEGDTPQKSITVTIQGASLASVVRELSEKYGFDVQGLDSIKTATLSATLSGSLRSILETLLRSCNYMLVRSTDHKSGIERVTIVNCAQLSAPSAGSAQDHPFDTLQHEPSELDQFVAPSVPQIAPQITSEATVSTNARFKAAQEKAKASGVHTLSHKDIEGLTSEQIKELRGY
jgi:hypothetical protein